MLPTKLIISSMRKKKEGFSFFWIWTKKGDKITQIVTDFNNHVMTFRACYQYKIGHKI